MPVAPGADKQREQGPSAARDPGRALDEARVSVSIPKSIRQITQVWN